ncbi:YidH family protein [Castellaniella sp.]|uniref:YidH family protein n=1 Tax=Castellaniella sp. TaxID=1955812 RepID=UPI00355CD25A
MAWHDEGKDPDYRFSLANERTFLAWIRTALAVLAVAIILRQFSGSSHAPQQAFFILSVVLAILSGIIGLSAFFRWRNNEHAMRLERALPVSTLILWLAITIAALAGGTALWLLLE